MQIPESAKAEIAGLYQIVEIKKAERDLAEQMLALAGIEVSKALAKAQEYEAFVKQQISRSQIAGSGNQMN